MTHKKNESTKLLKKEANLKFIGDAPKIGMRTVPFDITEMLFDMILDYSKRQVNAQCALHDLPNNTKDWTDEDFVVHTYQSVMKQSFDQIINHTEELERQLLKKNKK